ncbi:MAG: hypothetical protein ACREP2_10585 [Rhodanobacteraceae bacterium]
MNLTPFPPKNEPDPFSACELARKFEELERRVQQKLTTHDQAIAGILQAIRELMTPPEPPHPPIGFIRE